MSERAAYPNDRDCEYLMYLIISGDTGIPFEEFYGYCDNYNRWQPAEYTLRTALNRLVNHGLVRENGGVYYASPEIRAQFDAVRNPDWDLFQEMDELSLLVSGLRQNPAGGESHTL